MSDYKIIHDTIYGSIKLSGLLLELLETPEVQKLSGIHQLGLAYLVFPGANHTRLEHSLGTSFIANRIVNGLSLPDSEKDLVSCAALLHDVGHGPYSHTLEMMVHTKTGKDHTVLTKDLIEGKIDILSDTDLEVFKKRQRLSEIIEHHGLVPSEVAALIVPGEKTDNTVKLETFQDDSSQQFFNPKMYLTQIIHGEIDADQIDYLLRDSHYTGIAHGIIDVDRLIQTMEIYNNDLVIHRRGLSAVEGMLVARSLMYSSIYFHKTVRIAELMLARAVEHTWDSNKIPPLHQMVDYDLFNYLESLGGFPRDIVTKLKYRKLFKKIYSISSTEMVDEHRKALVELSDWRKQREKEQEICDGLGIPEDRLIIDVPGSELKISEPRIKRTQVKIRNKDLKPLSSYSPLARALQLRSVPDWELMVAVDHKYLDKATKIEKMIFQ